MFLMRVEGGLLGRFWWNRVAFEFELSLAFAFALGAFGGFLVEHAAAVDAFAGLDDGVAVFTGAVEGEVVAVEVVGFVDGAEGFGGGGAVVAGVVLVFAGEGSGDGFFEGAAGAFKVAHGVEGHAEVVVEEGGEGGFGLVGEGLVEGVARALVVFLGEEFDAFAVGVFSELPFEVFDLFAQE